MTLRDFVTILFGIGATACLAFVTLYAGRSRGWQRIDTGRNLMAVMAVLLALLGLITISRWWGPFPPALWTVLLILLDTALWWRVIILWRRQHEGTRS